MTSCDYYVQLTTRQTNDFSLFEESLVKSIVKPRFTGGLLLRDELHKFIPSLKPMIEPFVTFNDSIIENIHLDQNDKFYNNLCDIVKYYNIAIRCRDIYDKYDTQLANSISDITVDMFTEANLNQITDAWSNPWAIVLANLNDNEAERIFKIDGSEHSSTPCGTACDDQRCVFDTCPLVHYAILGNVEMCSVLLELGADLNAPEIKSFSFQGNTLHWIVTTGLYQDLKQYIPSDHKAWTMKNGLGLTPKDYL
jgi:hypothetical protein